MNIIAIIRKMRRNLNDFGLFLTFGKGLSYLLKKFYKKTAYRMFRRDLRGQKFPEPRPDGVVFGVVGNEDSQALRQIVQMEEWLDTKLQGFMSRGLCVAAFDGPRVTGFNLVLFQDISITPINLNLRPRPHQAWSKQITVLKAYRRRGLATALSYRVFAELQKRGIRTFYSGVMASNTPSMKLHEKVGFRYIADVQYTKVLKRERRIWSRTRQAGH